VRIRYTSLPNGRTVKRALVYTKDEHGINPGDVDREAVHIVERLNASGYETYIVGGAVRDLILGKKPKDFDIVSGASPTRIKKIFRNARIIGHRFRLVHVCFGPRLYEVSTFRSLRDGPTSNTFGTVEEDVRRRDFTLNALFYDPLQEVVVDYVGGMRDIREKRIRPIIPLSSIFIDDPVRMIRAVKYGAAAGFKLPLTLRWKIRRQSSLLETVSPSRLTEEILKIIQSSTAREIVEALDTAGLYAYLQPQAAARCREKAGFRDRYLASFAALNQPLAEGARPGEGEAPGGRLAALIRDFLEDETDWGGGPVETYKNAFLTARQFVLPMNPPRVELDRAVRIILAAHGIHVKKSRLFERKRPEDGAGPAGRVAGGKPVHVPPEGAEGKPAKRRRRRSPRPEPAGET
jgi:poly(A) polymerase